MTSAPQIVILAGEEYAIVPRAEYDALRTAVEEDAMDAAIIQRVLDDPDQELVPFELAKRIADGEQSDPGVARVSRYEGQRTGRCRQYRGLLFVRY